MVHQCELVGLPARPTLVARTRTALQRLPAVLGPAWGSVLAHAGKTGDASFVAEHNVDMSDLDTTCASLCRRARVGYRRC